MLQNQKKIYQAMTRNNFFQLFWFLWLIKPLTATSTLAKQGCKHTCGNVTIPYPFGIGAGCFLDKPYEIDCRDDRPYLKQRGGEVLNVSLDNSTITINANGSEIRLCENDAAKLAFNFSASPFFPDFYNKFIAVGCGNVMVFGDNEILGGCTSTCDQHRNISGCYGINCCEIIIPPDIQHIYFNFSSLETKANFCASVLLVEQSWYPRNLISTSDPSENLIGVPIPFVLRWALPKLMHPELQKGSRCYFKSSRHGWDFWDCKCPECTEGNPYIPNGCQDLSNKITCASVYNSRRRLIMVAVGVTSLGILFLVTFSFLLYKTISKRRKRKLKEKFFKRNGGLLLQQQMSLDENIIDKVRLFTATELSKATDSFNENRELGHGGQGTVYKGMLSDGKIVAVKKSKLAGEKKVVEFINEIVVLSQVNHRNVVKLLGCCLETDVPLLVYEFIPNGTLYNLIHNENDEFLMSWDMRLRIATEVAGALAYLHSASSVPIYHRDIKSRNILLDDKYRAKVSDFGTSKHITIDQTHLTTIVKGTFGYLDPEYFQTSRFTEKSDVYSFGVVLVELLTRQKPIPSIPTIEESCLSLATRFLISMEEDRLNMILDKQVLETASYERVARVAKLAQCCLSLDGKKRPTMREVDMELESIRMPIMAPSTVQTNFQEVSTGVETLVFLEGTSSRTTANDSITSPSFAYPLLSNTF